MMPSESTVKRLINQKLQKLLLHSLAKAESVEEERDGGSHLKVDISWGNIVEIMRQYADIEHAPQDYFKGQGFPESFKNEGQVMYYTHMALISFFDSYGIPVEVGTVSKVFPSDDQTFPPNPLPNYTMKVYPVDDADHQRLHEMQKICDRLQKSIGQCL
jgi:hypothetical protein